MGTDNAPKRVIVQCLSTQGRAAGIRTDCKPCANNRLFRGEKRVSQTLLTGEIPCAVGEFYGEQVTFLP